MAAAQSRHFDDWPFWWFAQLESAIAVADEKSCLNAVRNLERLPPKGGKKKATRKREYGDDNSEAEEVRQRREQLGGAS